MSGTKTIFGIDPARKAPWYKRLAARLFGKKFMGCDGTIFVCGRWYDDKLFIEKVENIKTDTTTSDWDKYASKLEDILDALHYGREIPHQDLHRGRQAKETMRNRP